VVAAVTVRYSEAFKLQVLRELEEGKHRSLNAAQEAYAIKGHGTVRRWLRRYGREQLARRVIRVETTKERDELKRLKERVRQLERALSDATLDLSLERAYVKLACRRAGIADVEDFKKKNSGQPSTTR
jgi:transposase-like protein